MKRQIEHKVNVRRRLLASCTCGVNCHCMRQGGSTLVSAGGKAQGWYYSNSSVSCVGPQADRMFEFTVRLQLFFFFFFDKRLQLLDSSSVASPGTRSARRERKDEESWYGFMHCMDQMRDAAPGCPACHIALFLSPALCNYSCIG